jgi:hypothetical protein
MCNLYTFSIHGRMYKQTLAQTDKKKRTFCIPKNFSEKKIELWFFCFILFYNKLNLFNLQNCFHFCGMVFEIENGIDRKFVMGKKFFFSVIWYWISMEFFWSFWCLEFSIFLGIIGWFESLEIVEIIDKWEAWEFLGNAVFIWQWNRGIYESWKFRFTSLFILKHSASKLELAGQGSDFKR